MTSARKKYRIEAFLLTLTAVAALVSCSHALRQTASRTERAPIFDENAAAGVEMSTETSLARTIAADSPEEIAPIARKSFPEALSGASDTTASSDSDSIPSLNTLPAAFRDSILRASRTDTTLQNDSFGTTAPPTPTARRERDEPFLEAPVAGTAQDSLVYDLRRKLIFHYNQGDITYEDVNLKADYIVVNAATKEIYATGMLDTAGVMTRPEFVQGGSNYTMDTVRYNLDTKKALVQGVATKDGEGFLLGRRMKRMPDNTINISQAKYTTCDLVEHPHFYIAMTKARVIPGKKIITGPAYFVMEDVPIYFLGIPGGFFPISTGPTAGLIMPTYGEESRRGFYLRGLGYYFTFGDHFDLSLMGDLYTLGSWGVNATSRYIKRYKYNGQLSANYQRLVMGDRNSTDYNSSSTFGIRWSHSMDPKASLDQSFSASVDYSTSAQKQLATTSLQDHLNTNTSSSISYSKRWNVGSTNVSLTAAFNLSTRSNDTLLNVMLPTINLSVGKFSPFARKVQVGKQRWYEKISLSYTMNARNATGDVKEYDFFTNKTLRNMQNGITHNIPVSMSFNLLNYINFTPSFNYQESWNFQRKIHVWDPDRGQNGGLVPVDELPSEFGFFRNYDWNLSGGFSTKIYGQFEVKRKPGKTGWLQAIRHVITPTVSFSYAPDFKHPRYGFYAHVQNNVNGNILEYIPVQVSRGNPMVTPRGPSASINGSISNQLEIKVKSDRDSTGMRKITILEQFAINSISWNFLAQGDSMHMGNGVNISIRTGELFKGFALQLSGQWNPYQYVSNGMGGVKQIRKFNIGHGKFGRLTNTSWSFGKTFNSPDGNSPGPGSINGQFIDPYGPDPYDMSNGLDPALRRQYMAQGWYDFSVPWSFTFNYNINYQYTGLKPKITQTLGFNGNVTLTQKWGINFNSGYDFVRRKLSHMQIGLMRDLHCWEMSFQWVPMGRTKMYSFHIGIKSGMLADIKYDKSSNAYDNLSY